MKKMMVASAMAMAMAAGSAMAANSGDIKFFGSVSAVTCNLVSEIDGRVADTLQLGAVAANGQGAQKHFTLKAAASDVTSCTTALTGRTATVSWIGSLNEKGFSNETGEATDAYVTVKALNDKTSGKQITKTQADAEFDATKALNEGYQFEAVLEGGEQDR